MSPKMAKMSEINRPYSHPAYEVDVTPCVKAHFCALPALRRQMYFTTLTARMWTDSADWTGASRACDRVHVTELPPVDTCRGPTGAGSRAPHAARGRHLIPRG